MNTCTSKYKGVHKNQIGCLLLLYLGWAGGAKGGINFIFPPILLTGACHACRRRKNNRIPVIGGLAQEKTFYFFLTSSIRAWIYPFS